MPQNISQSYFDELDKRAAAYREHFNLLHEAVRPPAKFYSSSRPPAGLMGEVAHQRDDLIDELNFMPVARRGFSPPNPSQAR